MRAAGSPRPAARARYGKTMAVADAQQKANRYRDSFFGGTGRYSRRLRSYGRRMYRRKEPYRRYGGRGMYGSFNMGAGIGVGVGGSVMGGMGGYAEGGGEAPQVMNEIVEDGAGLPVPKFTEGGELGSVTLSHREYIADIFAPETAGVFSNQTFGLNPALPGTFPWLSQVAANYEEYTIKQLIFTFRSTVTDFVASNGQVGTIIIATQYNANDAPFSSKQDMMEYAGRVSGKVSQGVVHGVECDPAQMSGSTGKYTRSGPAPPGEDIKTYDLGTVNVATANTPAAFNNQAVGELWVSYTVELRKPKFFVTRAQQLLTDVFVGDIGTGSEVPFNEIPWGVGQQNRIGGLLTSDYGATYPSNPNRLYYVFPQSFSGDVELIVTGGAGLNVIAQTTSVGLIPSSAPGIVSISDLWVNGGWSNTVVTLDRANMPTMTILHLKVVSPTTAASTDPNVVTLMAETISGATVNWRNFSLSVKMYNTGINYNKSQRPILANPQTQQVIEFPAGAGTLP